MSLEKISENISFEINRTAAGHIPAAVCCFRIRSVCCFRTRSVCCFRIRSVIAASEPQSHFFRVKNDFFRV